VTIETDFLKGETTMTKPWILTSAAALVATLFLTGTANARGLGAAEGVRVPAKFAGFRAPEAMPTPIADPALAGTAVPGCAAPVPAPCAPPCGPVCCPTPCIKYRHALLDLGRLCRDKCCKPPVKLVLATKNPCTCCPVDVPVCLPGSCCGEPIVDCRKSVIGEGIVTYEWCCGVSVVIRYKKCGEVLVTYRGV
jgi:hypothetical protein